MEAPEQQEASAPLRRLLLVSSAPELCSDGPVEVEIPETDAAEGWTVAKLKAFLCKRLIAVPASYFRLEHNGEHLAPSSLVSETGLKDGDEVLAVLSEAWKGVAEINAIRASKSDEPAPVCPAGSSCAQEACELQHPFTDAAVFPSLVPSGRLSFCHHHRAWHSDDRRQLCFVGGCWIAANAEKWRLVCALSGFAGDRIVSSAVPDSSGYNRQTLVVEAGLNARDLKNGCSATPAQLVALGFSPAEIASAGFSLTECKAGGLTAAEARDICSLPLKDLLTVGYSYRDCKEAGFSIKDFQEALGSTFDASLKALKDEAGFDAAAFLAAGVPLRALTTVFSLAEINNNSGSSSNRGEARAAVAGSTFPSPRIPTAGRGGAPPIVVEIASSPVKASSGATNSSPSSAANTALLKQMKEEGFTLQQMKDAGFSMGAVIPFDESHDYAASRALGATAKDFCEAGVDAAIVRKFGFSNEALKQGGYRAIDLLKADSKLTIVQLKNMGFSTKELVECRFTAADYLSVGLGPGAWKKAGIPCAEAKKLGFPLDLMRIGEEPAMLGGAAAVGGGGGGGPRLLHTNSRPSLLLSPGSSSSSSAALALALSSPTSSGGGGGAAAASSSFYSPNNSGSHHNAAVTGYSALEMKEAGYTLAQLRKAGFGLNDFAGCGFRAEDLMGPSASASASAAPSGAAAPLSPGSGAAQHHYFSVAEISAFLTARREQGGATALQLAAEGYGAGLLHSAGFGPYELLRAGFDRKALTAADVPMSLPGASSGGGGSGGLLSAPSSKDILASAASLAASTSPSPGASTPLAGSGAPPAPGAIVSSLRQGTLSSGAFGSASGANNNDTSKASSRLGMVRLGRIPKSSLKEDGLDAAKLKEVGATADELKAAGFDAISLAAAGYSARQMSNAKFPLSELQVIFSLKELQAVFTPAQLKDAGVL